MDTKLTLLYVEDEDGIRSQLSKFLRYFSTIVYTATNGKEGLELYKKHLPDIVISDIKMPIMNGIEMVKAIKEINQKQHIIFTTAHSESNYFMDAIDMQVDGYILKPIDLKKLEQKLEQIQEHINLKKYYIRHQKELEYKAYTDNLTQIYNRRYFEDILDKEIKKYQIEKTPLSLIIFDIDKFKNFNDTYGHQIGDEILKALAKIIKEGPSNGMHVVFHINSLNDIKNIFDFSTLTYKHEFNHMIAFQMSSVDSITILGIRDLASNLGDDKAIYFNEGKNIITKFIFVRIYN